MSHTGKEIVRDAERLVEASRETMKDLRAWMAEAPGKWPRIRIAGFG